MSTLEVQTCRLCAESKRKSETVDLTTNLSVRCEIITNLAIFSVKVVDFSNKSLPETVCTECRNALRISGDFWEKIQKSQNDLYNTFCSDIPSNLKVKIEREMTPERSENEATSDCHSNSSENNETKPKNQGSSENVVYCSCEEPIPASTNVKEEETASDSDDDLPLLHKYAGFPIELQETVPVQHNSSWESHSGAANLITESSKDIIYKYTAWNKPKEPSEEQEEQTSANYSVSKKRKKATIDDLTCDVCFKTFSIPAKLKYHKVVHKTNRSRDYICDLCGKAYYAEQTLFAHKLIHNPENHRTCEICKKTFSNPIRLKKHMVIHEAVKQFQCDECKRRFRTKRQMQNHMIIHRDEYPYPCKYCEKRFKHKVNYKNHENVHTGQRPFVCTDCGRGFTNWSNCHKHKKRKHGLVTTDTASDNKFTGGDSSKLKGSDLTIVKINVKK